MRRSQSPPSPRAQALWSQFRPQDARPARFPAQQEQNRRFAPRFATEGLPNGVQIAGFVLAALGIWLVARPEGGTETKGLGLAVMAGFGFAAFFLCIKQAGNGSALWIADLSRVTSLAVT